ncbi:MAG: metallophosphoesterase family protein [Clostridia bacterium]|nr:metallophosphoesterase family protein [Clostridia bacterium]
MKKLRTPLSVLLAAILLLSSAVCFNASALEKEVWDTNWAENTAEIAAAVTMTPASNDTDRYISWYSASDSGTVTVKNEDSSTFGTFEAEAVATPQGDYRLVAYISGLEEGKTYTYTCQSGDRTSAAYTIAAYDTDSFTAVYVSDIHVSYNENNSDEIRDNAYALNETLTTAANKAAANGSTLDLILSGGDQASEGMRVEYEGLVANGFMKTIPFAPCIGNHDRKSVDYRYFNAIQYGTVDMAVKSYVGTDYWFVKGDVLFMVMDSNNISMGDHEKFVKKAVSENPDAKWRVAIFHHDLYSGRKPNRESENQWLRLMWAPIADKYGFDLCLLGHSHYYTISNVLYNNKPVSPVENNATITDPQGTIYMVTGSINRPRGEEDDIGLREADIGHAVLTTEKIYNLIDFSEDSIVLKSYTVESDECIGSVTIKKTTNEGGHSYSTPAAWYYPLVKVISAIAGIINNIGRYYDNTQLGFDIPLFDGIFG